MKRHFFQAKTRSPCADRDWVQESSQAVPQPVASDDRSRPWKNKRYAGLYRPPDVPIFTPGYLLLLLSLFACLFVSGGATCVRWPHESAIAAPAAFTAPPTLQDIVLAVNASTERIHQLQSDSATLTAAGLPSLRSSIALERPSRFRLRGKLFGPEIDLGSNEQLVWFWARSDPNKAVYYARHDELERLGPNQPLPLDPQWLVEAFGLVHLEPEGFHEGPFPMGDGRVAVRTHLQRGTRQLLRTLVIDATYGWVVEQTIVDEHGQTLAQVRSSGHQHDAISNTSLPHRIAIDLPQANLSFRIDIAEYIVNQLYGSPQDLWEPPQGYNFVNLAAGNPPTALAPQSLGAADQALTNGSQGYRPSYRGYTTIR